MTMVVLVLPSVSSSIDSRKGNAAIVDFEPGFVFEVESAEKA